MYKRNIVYILYVNKNQSASDICFLFIHLHFGDIFFAPIALKT